MDSVSAARAGKQFEGLLLEQMLSPLAESFGQSAAFLTGPLAQSIAAHDSHGFGEMLAAILLKSGI